MPMARVVCSALPLAKGINIGDYAVFQQAQEDRRHGGVQRS